MATIAQTLGDNKLSDLCVAILTDFCSFYNIDPHKSTNVIFISELTATHFSNIYC